MSEIANTAIRFRESLPGDYVGIAGVVRACGLSMVSEAEYERRWSENPFTPADKKGQTGWLMETEGGEICGWVGNIYSGYELNGRPLVAASAHALAVLEKYRGKSLPLLARFFRQGGVDLLLSTTANQTAEKVYTGFKAARAPHPSYDRVLYWIIDPAAFYAAAFRRTQALVPGLLGRAAGIALLPTNWRNRRSMKRYKGKSTLKRPAHFDGRFDLLWNQLRERRDRLLAVRSSAALSWHFGGALQENRLAIVSVEEQGELAGYAVLLRRDAPAVGLRRFTLVDLQVIRDDANLVRALTAGAMDVAQEQGVHVVEAVGFDAFKRGVLELMGPRTRLTPSWPYLYKALAPDLGAALASPSAWDACPYDGDAAF